MLQLQTQSFIITLLFFISYLNDTAKAFQFQPSLLNGHPNRIYRYGRQDQKNEEGRPYSFLHSQLDDAAAAAAAAASSSNDSQTRSNNRNVFEADNALHNLQSRRNNLQSMLTALSITSPLPLTCIVSNPQPANAAQTTGEAIRRSAANIPGYGQADVFYPSSFLGKWKATRVIVSLSPGAMESYFPLLSSASSSSWFVILQELLPLTISYDVRFVTVDGDDMTLGGNDGATSGDENRNSKVIADRQFNEESLYNALRSAMMANIEDAAIKQQLPSIQTVSWSPSNPNVLSSSYNDGSSKEIKVTKRAAELDISNGIISSSEYRRITTVSGGRSGSSTGMVSGIPSISASRALNKWKISNDGNGGNDFIEGIEIVYADGIVGDPMSAGVRQQSPAQPQQQSNSKSRLRLERL